MEKRIIFNSKEIRDLFFQKVLNSFNLQKWKEIRGLLSIPKSMLEFYRNGKLSLPEKLYFSLSNKFKEKDKLFFNKNFQILDSNWGRIKAGKITYSKYKYIFDEGRKKAIQATQKRTHKFDINLPLTFELAYFIGLFIGDGFTNKYGQYYQIQFTGDKKEKLFYCGLFSNYCKQLFNLLPKIKNDKNSNAIRINLYSIDLFNLITQRFKISAGRKSHTVLIPEEIMNAKSDIIKACIRGIYDAEGCVFFDKRSFYKKPYPRIELHMCNAKLLKDIHNLLINFGIKCYLGKIKDNLRITIWGFDEVKRFVNVIGFSNPKHLEKLRILKD